MGRLYFLRKLRSFNACSKMLESFYWSVLPAGAVFFAEICWGGHVRAGEARKLNKLIKVALSVLGCSLDSYDVVMERRKLNYY